MKDLRYTLLSDGSSDKALIPILTWLLQAHNNVECAIQPTWADLRRLPRPPKTLILRIIKSLELYPCDLLFIHRDAEKEPRSFRVAEIREAIEEAGESVCVPIVCVVPVRMQEAWLLFDEAALRRASGNPCGRQPLQLPVLGRVEQLPDPKNVLYTLLHTASGLTGRRLKDFPVRERAIRVAELINDFTPLRGLSAFSELEAELEQVMQTQGWCSGRRSE